MATTKGVTVELPTVGEVHAFVAKINETRVAAGLEPLTKIEFDEARPGSCRNCLSARHMVGPVEEKLGPGQALRSYTLRTPSWSVSATMFSTGHGGWWEANGFTPAYDKSGPTRIPGEILQVTNAFDALAEDEPGFTKANLRAVFVEAGYVSP